MLSILRFFLVSYFVFLANLPWSLPCCLVSVVLGQNEEWLRLLKHER
jgi:hypothetical protein